MTALPPRDLPLAMRQLGGTATSPELQARLGISQPTASRLLAPLLADGSLVAVGSARARRYLMPRDVPGVGRQVPIHSVQPDGSVQFFGTLYPLAGEGFWMEEADREHGQSARHDSLPWFLYDMRPQGFLGRGFLQNHPALQLPSNLTHWSDDHILKALVHAGEDMPGNLLVGTPAFDRFHSLPAPLRTGAPRISDPATDYPVLAEQALAQGSVGSSAGGEQPKFSAVREGHAVLVKFSPADDSAASQRWRDLLVCEGLALQTLSDAGLSAAHTTLELAAGRVFLESRRFDRNAHGGRLGMVSLEVYDRQYIGAGTSWVDTAQRSDRGGEDIEDVGQTGEHVFLGADGEILAAMAGDQVALDELDDARRGRRPLGHCGCAGPGAPDCRCPDPGGPRRLGPGQHGDRPRWRAGRAGLERPRHRPDGHADARATARLERQAAGARDPARLTGGHPHGAHHPARRHCRVWAAGG